MDNVKFTWPCPRAAGILTRLFPWSFFLGCGERVGTTQLGSPDGQGLPCRLPRRLYSAYINRKHSRPRLRCISTSSSADRATVCCNECSAFRIGSSLRSLYARFLCLSSSVCVSRVRHLHAHSVCDLRKVTLSLRNRNTSAISSRIIAESF